MSNPVDSWRERLSVLRTQRPSRTRDLSLSLIVDEAFDVADQDNVEALLLSFTSDIDTSVLQSFENALGRIDHALYFSSLGRCFEVMAKVNPRIATERINYPGRELTAPELNEGFLAFAANLASVDLLVLMRSTIVEWRLLGSEPYRTFFYLSQSFEGKANG